MLLRVWVGLLALVYELSKPSGHTMMTFITVKVRVEGARERVSIAGGVDPRLFHSRHAHMLRDILKQEWTQCGAEWHRWGVVSASENDARSEITSPPSRQSITQPTRVRFSFFLWHISCCSATTRVLTLLTSLFNGAFLAKDPERLMFWSVNNIDYSKKLTWYEKLELVLPPSKSIWDNTPDAK